MKTIKIFLASSDELKKEREMFGDFVSALRLAFEPHGIDLKLEKWEYYNSAFQGTRKESEYIAKLKKCQLFVALFHIKAGKYTKEELEAARKSLDQFNVPSIFIFMKDLQEGEQRSDELEELKEKILNSKEWEHFNDRYNHLDTLKLQFLHQFIINLKDSSLQLEVEDSMISFNNTPVANLDNMPFATNNAKYQELKQQIAEANKIIEGLEKELSKGESSFLQGMVNQQKKLREDLRQQLEKCEKDLLVSSQRIAALKSEGMNQRTRKVVELFEKGDKKGADELLNFKDIQNDIRWISNDVEAAWENAKSIISQLMFKAQNLLTLYDKPNRIEEAITAYEMALDCAKKTRLSEDFVVDLFDKYQSFLMEQGRIDKALEICAQWLRTAVFAFGEDHFLTANALNSIGNVYTRKGEFEKALDSYLKALKIRQNVFSKDHPTTAITYNNIGGAYNSLGRYSEALESYVDALMICLQVFGEGHLTTATTNNNIGGVYNSKGEYATALNYYQDALTVYEKVLGNEHPTTATVYNNIGFVYSNLGKYDLALKNLVGRRVHVVIGWYLEVSYLCKKAYEIKRFFRKIPE